jgi:RNA polymerase sigma-70 factor (ECF subfamily)
MSEKSDDVQILKRFKGGDSTAFEEIVLKYQGRIYNLCRHMLGDAHDAQDAAQGTFIKAYQNLKKFKPESSLYTWLYRIAVNTCLDYKKRPFLVVTQACRKDTNFYQSSKTIFRNNWRRLFV